MMQINPNSAKIWFPAIEEHLPVPKTLIVPYDHIQFLRWFECHDNYESVGTTLAAILEACETIGYPCFIRTDLASAKHAGPDSYLAKSKEDVEMVLSRTVADNEMKLWPYARAQAFMIREFLPLNYSFKAFGDMPVAREFRFFASSDEVRCYHPYWPEEAIHFWDDKEPDNWKELLKADHEPPKELDKVVLMAQRAAHLVSLYIKQCYPMLEAVTPPHAKPGFWSVDFAQDVHGKWWLIDMARASESYHWPECKNEIS